MIKWYTTMKTKCIKYKIGKYIFNINYNCFFIPEPQHINEFQYAGNLESYNYYNVELIEFNNEIIKKELFFENNLGLKIYKDDEEYILDYCDEDKIFVKRVIYDRISKNTKVYIYPHKIIKSGHHFIESTQFQMLFMLILAENNSFLLHSNLIKIGHNQGICFCGKSGNGKTTLSTLFKTYDDDCVLTDETVLISIREGEVFASGTPWKGSGANYYKNEEVNLKKLYLINHGKHNYVEQMDNSSIVKEIALQTFPYFWDKRLLYMNLNKVSILSKLINIKKLFFYPDEKVIEFIKEDNND